jgi:biotin carboxylase
MTDTSAAPKTSKVLVVGTTADYIQWIRKVCPGRALFLTAPGIRQKATEPVPEPCEELVCSLSDIPGILAALGAHVAAHNQVITGIACFDCESMETAAHVAHCMNLEYPSASAVTNCRNKLVSKNLWQMHNITCPRVWPVHSLADVTRCLAKAADGLVLKPAFGSGSELVFLCRTLSDAATAYQTLATGLEKRRKNPLFGEENCLILAEELVSGPEYSCDFILGKDGLTLVRLTRKIKPSGLPFGTVAGYEIPAALPPHTSILQLEDLLLQAAHALGIHTGICMVDFIVKNNRPYFIEMTPRPGGDCLPHLLMVSGNLDILKLTLDVAENRPWNLDNIPFVPHMGIRVHARKAGVLKAIHSHHLAAEPRVRQMHFIREPGHVIVMPPDDYDSWLLGHVIIQTDGCNFPETRSMLLAKRLEVEIQQ